MRSIRTGCTYDCPDACGLVVNFDKKGAILQGDSEHPITGGFLCKRIRKHIKRLNHSERVTEPRIRVGNTWKTASWNEALAQIASKLEHTISHEGYSSVFYMSGGGSLGLSKCLIPHFFQSLGPITTLSGGVCGRTGETAQRRDFGEAACHDYLDLINSRAVVLWGKNPAATGVHLLPSIVKARKRGAPVVLIEIRPSESARLADRVIRISPSGDGYLALAVLRKLYEIDAIPFSAHDRVDNIEEFENFLFSEDLTVEKCALHAGSVPIEDIEYLADIYSTKSPVSTWIGWGLQRRSSGGRNVRCIDALGLLSGQVGIAGGGVNYTSPRKKGLDFSRIAQPSGRQIPISQLGPTLIRMDNPPIRFAYIAGANPVTQLPQSRTISEALKKIDFTVVADAFFTDTAEAADLFLPVSLMLEEDDYVGSFQHHHVARVKKVFEPPHGVRNDLWIMRELNRLLQRPSDPILDDPWEALEDIIQPWFNCRTDFNKLNPMITPVPFRKEFPTSSGKAHLITKPPQFIEEQEGFPLILLTPSCRNWQTSQKFEEDQRGQLAECYIHPHPLGLSQTETVTDGSKVYLESKVGQMEVIIRLEPKLKRNECVVLRGGWLKYGQGVNVLVECRTSDMGGGTSLYDQRVRIVPT